MKIVVGYIPSPEGEAALTFAVEEALAHKAELVIVNSGRGESIVDDSFAAADEAVAIRKRIEDAGVTCEFRQPVRGRDAGDEIITAAEELQARMIVIGSRHRSAVGKLLLGSVALDVLIHAECPVIAVKAPPT
jgi:nucleotide-binding universal stress UspA family protein